MELKELKELLLRWLSRILVGWSSGHSRAAGVLFSRATWTGWRVTWCARASAQDAISEVRARRPGSIRAKGQEACVF